MATLHLLIAVVVFSPFIQYQFVNSSDVSDWCNNDLQDPYQLVLDFVSSQNIAETELQNIIDSVLTRAGCYWLQGDSLNDLNCTECLKASDIYQHYFKISANINLSQEQFYNVSTILMTYVYQLKTVCSRTYSLDWTTVTSSYFVEQLMHVPDMFSDHAPHHEDGELFTAGMLETVLRNVSESYIPGQKLDQITANRPDDVSSTCALSNLRSVNSFQLIDSTSTNHSDGVEEEQLGLLSSYFVSQLLHGSCITPADVEVPISDAFVQSVYETFGAGHNCVFNETGILEVMSNLGVSAPDHDHDHSATEQRAADVIRSFSLFHEIDVKTTCVNIDDIFTSFGINNPNEISRTDFHKLCPALLQQGLIGCVTKATAADTQKPSAAEAYGYGTLAVLIICLLSTLGLIIVKFKHTKVYHYLLVGMLGLAVGALVGDSLLHLLPQALGLHDHDHDHSSHSTSGVTVEDYTWKMLTCCGSVWLFYILQLSLLWIERIMKRRSSTTHPRRQASNKTIGAAVDKSSSDTVDKVGYDTTQSTTVSVTEDSSTNFNVVNDVMPTVTSLEGGNVPDYDVTMSDSSVSSRRHSVASLSHVHVHSTVAWMVIIGDALHNFTDGLAIGASFGLGWSAGLSTAIAVACHELPHEFGDVAILLSAGWSPLKVFIFQLVSASTAFVGLYIGIAVSDETEVVQQWIFVIAAGLFLYVALADVIPELIENFERGNAVWMFLISNGGIFLGFLAMTLLSVFEEKIVIQ